MTPPTRRSVIKAAGLAASAAGAACLTGCSKSEDVKAGPAQVKVADVPVGGGKIIDNSNYVVTQPTKGTFEGFTRLCPHAGCNVNRISGTNIICPCHGSNFSIKDGSVTLGPATTGLTKAKVTVSGDTLTVSSQ